MLFNRSIKKTQGRVFYNIIVFLVSFFSWTGRPYADTKYYVVTDTSSGYQFEVREVESGYSKCLAYSIHQLPEKARLSSPDSWTRSLACSLKSGTRLGAGGKNDKFMQIAQWQEGGVRSDRHNVVRMLKVLRRLTGYKHYGHLVKRVDGRSFYSVRYSFESLSPAFSEGVDTRFSSGFEGEWLELSSSFFDITELKRWDADTAMELMSCPHKEIRWHFVGDDPGLKQADFTGVYKGSGYYFYTASRNSAAKNACRKSAPSYTFGKIKKEHSFSAGFVLTLMLTLSAIMASHEPPTYMDFLR